MVILEKYNATYEVDVELTKAYYDKHSRIADIRMRNFEKHMPDASPELAEFLAEFGVDSRYPDELCWCWKDDAGKLHYNVAYTIAGRLVRAEQYEMLMRDKSQLHIIIETEYVPNEQEGPYFAFTIYNIEMPWALAEPYPEPEEHVEKEREGFLRKILKKYWTK